MLFSGYLQKQQMSTIIKFLYFSGLTLFSFFYWKRTPVAYEVPKVYLFNIWVGILTLLTAISIIKGKQLQINKSKFFLIFLFLGYTFICSLFGKNFPKSVVGNYYRIDGLITLVNLVLLTFVTAVNWKNHWIHLLSKVSAISIVFMLFDLVLGKGNSNQAVSLNFGNSNFLGGYLAITLPLLFFFFHKTKYKFLGLVLILTQILIIFLTHSWSAVIVGILAVAGSLLILVKGKVQKILGFLIFFSIAIFIFYLYLTQYNQVKSRFIGGYMPEGRGRIFTKAILAVKAKPWLGWGWANFDYAFEEVVWPMKYQHDLYVDKAHSHLLEIAVTAGLPGLLLYLILVTSTLRQLIIQKNKYLTLIFLLFLLHSQTNIISISEEIYFWIIIGIATSNT
jgi:O-antigen ligase